MKTDPDMAYHGINPNKLFELIVTERDWGLNYWLYDTTYRELVVFDPTTMTQKVFDEINNPVLKR